jgi:hypothetical protein
MTLAQAREFAREESRVAGELRDLAGAIARNDFSGAGTMLGALFGIRRILGPDAFEAYLKGMFKRYARKVRVALDAYLDAAA